MEFSNPEESKSSSSEETDRSAQNDQDTGTGRSYECVFCKRGFTTAQALGGHMNIHRKDRSKTKPLNPSTSTKLDNNYYTHLGFYSALRSHPGSYCNTAPDEDTNNYPPIYFAAPSCGPRPSHLQYGEVFCEENQRHRDSYGEDWRRSLSLHTNPFCVRENKGKDEVSSEEDGLDLELRLGHHP